MIFLDRHTKYKWVWPAIVLLLALALRLVWVQDAGFTHDVSFFVRWMRLAAGKGVGQVFVAAKSSYPPLSVYLLGLLGRVNQAVPLDAPPTPVELLTLRLSIIFSDLLMIALLYQLGRRAARHTVATEATLLYALCPGSIYLSGWWVQIDAWFVLPMVLGAWWLAQKRTALAWGSLGLAMMLKLQAAIVLPVFIVGTWRWCGVRRLVIGVLALALMLAVTVAPILSSGQKSDLLSKMTQPTRYFQWITLESHNLWFALTARARDLGHDANRDLHAFVGGVSFRDAGLGLLALGYGLLLTRLFVRSGPRSIFAACAVAWLVFFTLPTRIDARYFFPALALMLCAGFYRRRWWALYVAAAMTLLVNLVWKSRDISPLMAVWPITPAGAVVNAWVNVIILALGLLFYGSPLLGAAQSQTDREGRLSAMGRKWEAVLLGGEWLTLLVLLGAMFWHGRTIGAQLTLWQSPLRASLDEALQGADHSEPIVVINWPRTIMADRSVNLGNVIPVTPPALFLATPDTIHRDATWVQYPPWQRIQALDLPGSSPDKRSPGWGQPIEYYGAYVTQTELSTLVQKAGRVVTFSPSMRRMYLLAKRQTAAAVAPCPVDFGPVCLTAVQARPGENLIELTWQITGALSDDVTVFVHVIGPEGNLIVQADGDPAGGLAPLAHWGYNSNQIAGLYETRLVALSPNPRRVRIGLYNRTSRERLVARCAPTVVCVDNAVEISVTGH